MIGIVDHFCNSLGWKPRECNFIVEGTSDVEFFQLAAFLYYSTNKRAILGDKVQILASGMGDDGGVEGVNRRLSAARQLADRDRLPDGTVKFRFFGLFDNDYAGRRAFKLASEFDRRVVSHQDIFLLHPVMPEANGCDPKELGQRIRKENIHYSKLDWEIEDLISDRLWRVMLETHPEEIKRTDEENGKKHRELTRAGKAKFREICKAEAKLEDMSAVVDLLYALHDYSRVDTSVFSR